MRDVGRGGRVGRGGQEDRTTGRERHVLRLMLSYINRLTYLPHKAVAEVSSHNEPTGRMFGIQLVRKSIDFGFDCFEIASDLTIFG